MLEICNSREVQTMSIIYVIKETYMPNQDIHFLDKETFIQFIKNDLKNIVNLDCYYIDDEKPTLSMERLDVDTIRLIL